MDDDLTPTTDIAPPSSSTTIRSDALPMDDAEDGEQELQDYGSFVASVRSTTSSASSARIKRKPKISSQTIRKGQKDFEPQSIKSQDAALEASRQAMQDVLSYARRQRGGDGYVRGWYFPEQWANSGTDEEEAELRARFPGNEIKVRKLTEERREMYTRERVVAVKADKTLGRVVRSQGKGVPGADVSWLLPEEALWLVERGSMDLWWPNGELRNVFPPNTVGGWDDVDEAPVGDAATDQVTKQEDDQAIARDETQDATDSSGDLDDLYAQGLPMSLQAAYAMLIGGEGERGKISLQKYEVYANLSRLGFHVLRRPPSYRQSELPLAEPAAASTGTILPLWQRLQNLLLPEPVTSRAPFGPLVPIGWHRNYTSIYRHLQLVPKHMQASRKGYDESHLLAKDPFRIHFHAWKSSIVNWSKTEPPCPPSYNICVVDAQQTDVPTQEELDRLFATVPEAAIPLPRKPGIGPRYQRLKHGQRNVIIAVVDHGLVNYNRFAETSFGDEALYPDFDAKGGLQRGRKGRGRSGGVVGRGGAVGRGRGRGPR